MGGVVRLSKQREAAPFLLRSPSRRVRSFEGWECLRVWVNKSAPGARHMEKYLVISYHHFLHSMELFWAQDVETWERLGHNLCKQLARKRANRVCTRHTLPERLARKHANRVCTRHTHTPSGWRASAPTAFAHDTHTPSGWHASPPTALAHDTDTPQAVGAQARQPADPG